MEVASKFSGREQLAVSRLGRGANSGREEAMLEKCLCSSFPLEAIALLFFLALLVFQNFKVLPCPSVLIVRGIHLVHLCFRRD